MKIQEREDSKKKVLAAEKRLKTKFKLKRTLVFDKVFEVPSGLRISQVRPLTH